MLSSVNSIAMVDSVNRERIMLLEPPFTDVCSSKPPKTFSIASTKTVRDQ